MSYILDALRKAERDRQATPVPTIDAVHTPILVGRTLRLWPWLVVGALAVNVVVVAAVLRSRSVDVPPSAGPTVAETVAPPAPIGAAAARPRDGAGAPAAPAPPKVAGGDGPVSATKPRAAEDHVATAIPRAADVPAAAAVPKTQEQPRDLERAPAAAAPAATTPPHADAVPPPTVTRHEPRANRSAPTAAQPAAPRARVDQATAKAAEPAPTTGPSRKTDVGVPALQDLPATFRDSAPKLRLEVLLYSDAPAERMVFINGRKYKEGDTVEGKAVVESIVRDGAVLSYQGQRFLLRE